MSAVPDLGIPLKDAPDPIRDFVEPDAEIKEKVAALSEWLCTLDIPQLKTAIPIFDELNRHAATLDKDIWLKAVHHRDYADNTPPVDPETFLDNPYYLGEWGKTIYPIWRKDLIHVLDPMRRIEEWALVGAQGTGKTTAAVAAQFYKMYRFSKLKAPQRYFDLDVISKIYFGLFSLNEDKAQTVLYDKLQAVLNQSPYFRDRFPQKTRRRSLRVAKGLSDSKEEADALNSTEILFPSNLRVIAGSLTAHAVSIDLMSAILDEMNWKRKKTVRADEDVNSAISLYEQVRNRIRGRFLTKHQTSPGLLCIISSKRATTDFMDGLAARLRKEPHRAYVSDYALWEAKPDRKFSGKKFAIFIGGSYGQSRIMDPDEAAEYDLDDRKSLPTNVLAVPEEFRTDFESNLNTALRDIGGISTVPYQLLFENDTQIRAAEDPTRLSPFNIDEILIGVNSKDTIDKYFNVEQATRFDGIARKPKAYPLAPRYIHIDLSKSGDCTGISMVCPSALRKIISKTPDGKDAIVLTPMVHVDFMIRIRAPKGDQIDYGKIRQFVIYLRRLGYRIGNVSFDQYQSVDSMQILQKEGFKTSYVSVDRSDIPYLTLKMAFAQHRLSIYQYMPLLVELRQLIHDLEDSSVDHPDVDADGGPGSKDVADSLCGACWALFEAISAVKPSTKSPTTLDAAKYGEILGENPDAAKTVAQTFMERLLALENPESVAVMDYQIAEDIASMDLRGKRK